MPTGRDPHLRELFAEDLIQSYVDDPGFVHRNWLTDQIDGAIARGRVVLLVGDSGTGKSAVLADLARAHPDWLRYFIRRGSTSRGAGDTRSFLFAIGHQLAASRPDLIRSRELDIVVEQRIREVLPGAEATAIAVRNMVVSPFAHTAFAVLQDISLLAGKLSGVTIDNLTVEDRLLDVANLQHLALFDPAGAQLRRDPADRIVVLVDALDEVRFMPEGDSVVDWLATSPDLPANVSLVLTCRQDPDLVSRLEEHLRPEKIVLLPDDPRVQSDLKQVLRLISADAEFVARAADAAHGNLMYAAALGRELAHGPIDWTKLPADLGALYELMLGRVRAQARHELIELPGSELHEPTRRLPAWEGLYVPLLAVLAVALEPLSRAQLARFIHVPDRWLHRALGVMSSLLRPADETVTYYHTSIAEFVQRTGIRDGHNLIARGYRGSAASWNDVAWDEVDDYGLRHLSAHLAELAQSESGRRTEPYALLCESFMWAKRRRYGAHWSFSADVRTAIGSYASLTTDVHARYLLMLLGSLEARVPWSLLIALARLGDTDRVLELVRNGPPGRRAVGLLIGALGLIAEGDIDNAEAVLRTALEVSGTPFASESTVDDMLRVAMEWHGLPQEVADYRSRPRDQPADAKEVIRTELPDAAREVTSALKLPSDGEVTALIRNAVDAILRLPASDRPDRAWTPLLKMIWLTSDREQLRRLAPAVLSQYDGLYGDHIGYLTALAVTAELAQAPDILDAAVRRILTEPDNTFRADGLSRLAASVAPHVPGLVEKLSEAAAGLDRAFVNPDEVRARLASGLASTQRTDEGQQRATDLLQGIDYHLDDGELWTALLVQLADALADTGRTAEAAEACADALAGTDQFVEMHTTVAGTSLTVGGDRAFALGDIAAVLAKCGKAPEALEAAQSSVDAMARALTDLEGWIWCAKKFLPGLVRLGLFDQADGLVADLAGSMGGARSRVAEGRLNAFLVPHLHAADATDRAANHLRQARMVLQQTGDHDVQGDIALAQARMGARDDALDTAAMISDDTLRVAALLEVADTALDQGHNDFARVVAERIRTEPLYMFRANTAELLARLGRRDEARELISPMLTDESLEWTSEWVPGAAGAAAWIDDDELMDCIWFWADGLIHYGTPLLVPVVRRIATRGRGVDMRRLAQYATALDDRVLAARVARCVLDTQTANVDWWRALVADERVTDLQTFTETLVQGFPALAAVDSGRTLAELGSQVRATHAWWTGP